MTCPRRRLILALCISFVAHLLALLPYAQWLRTSRPPPRPPLQARLQLPPPPAAIPPLILPEPVRPSPPPPAAAKPALKPAATWQAAAKRQIGQLYSAEAIAQRLEGEAVVLFILDEQGNVSAARIEQSSGHPILDRDALNAIRKLRALPADAPREIVLPLRFRLKD